MKQLSHLLTLLAIVINVTVQAQTNIQQDRRVDPLLKQVDAKRPGLMMFSRQDNKGKYVNMAVLSDSTRTLTWFTCYGQAFDVVKLNEDAYNKIRSHSLNPFDYYKDYFSDLLSHVRTAAALFRQEGKSALNDTGNIYHRVYTYPPVQQAQSTLQKEVAMEKLMSELYLQLSLFDSQTPQHLTLSDSFQLRMQLAGRMIRKGDTTSYHNANPLSSAARIVLYKRSPDRMFVYDRHGQLADSVPLKEGKHASLLNEKEDVFLLYRGWLELQSQQAIAGKEEVDRLLNREYTMLYKPVYWEQNKQHLQHTLSEAQEQVDAIGCKVMGLIVPSQEEAAQLLATVHRDKPAEISYLPNLGFAYSVVYIRGNKQYELTDHRGNVMAAVSDRKKGIDENGDGQVEYYNPDVVSAVDYFPFGSQMPGRVYSGEDKYRYGFNGKENDNEVKGEGNQQDYGMRIYDPRLGRFLSVDPLTRKYPELTPYQFAGNTPVVNIDLNGLEPVPSARAYKGATMQDIQKASDFTIRYLKATTAALINWADKANPWNVSEERMNENEQNFGNLVTAVGHPRQTARNIKSSIINWGHRLQSSNPDVSGTAFGQGLAFAADIYTIKGMSSASMAFYEGNSIIRKAVKDGVKIMVATSDDDLAYLRQMGAQALYMEGEGKGGYILMSEAASRAQVLEEAIHHQQRLKYGTEYVQDLVNKARLEIQAQDELLRIGKKENWAISELEEISRAKTKWQKHLKELQKQ